MQCQDVVCGINLNNFIATERRNISWVDSEVAEWDRAGEWDKVRVWGKVVVAGRADVAEEEQAEWADPAQPVRWVTVYARNADIKNRTRGVYPAPKSNAPNVAR